MSNTTGFAMTGSWDIQGNILTEAPGYKSFITEVVKNINNNIV